MLGRGRSAPWKALGGWEWWRQNLHVGRGAQLALSACITFLLLFLQKVGKVLDEQDIWRL